MDESLASYLRATREHFAYSTAEVSHLTGISEKFLSYLENGQYHRLPADVYVLGFLRSLAELYRCDASVLAAQYRRECNVSKNVKQAKQGQQYRAYSPPRFAITPRSITVSAVVVFALFVLGYLFYQVRTVSQPPSIVVSSPHSGDIVHTSSIVVMGHTDVGDQLTINGQAVLVDSSGSFSAPVSLTPGPRELTFVAKNTFGKTSTEQVTVIADFQNASTSAASQLAASSLSLDVTTLAPNVTVTIQSDTSTPVTVLFATPDSKTFTAQAKIVIGTSNAGATDVQLDGKDMGKLGKIGQPIAGVVFTSGSLGQ